MKKLMVWLGLLVSFSLAQEDDALLKTPMTKKLPDMNVSIGVVEIKGIKEKFPRAYEILKKHYGEPTKYDTHHLAVSLWKEEKGKIVYISDYKVSAEVRSPLLRSQMKTLDTYPHQYGNNYGHWFQMSDRGLYSINVYIYDKKGKRRTVNFDYLNQ